MAKTTSVCVNLRLWSNSKNKTMETLILECLPKVYKWEAAQKAYHYSQRILGKRWKEAEHLIMTHPHFAYLYSKNIMKKAWREAEPFIATCEESSYYYSKFVLKSRFPLFEENFSKGWYICPETKKKKNHGYIACRYLYLYSKHISKERLSRFCENQIKDSYGEVPANYSINILKKRWKGAEKHIVKSDCGTIDKYIRSLNLKDRREFRRLLLAESMSYDNSNTWYRCPANEWFKFNEASTNPVVF